MCKFMLKLGAAYFYSKEITFKKGMRISEKSKSTSNPLLVEDNPGDFYFHHLLCYSPAGNSRYG